MPRRRCVHLTGPSLTASNPAGRPFAREAMLAGYWSGQSCLSLPLLQFGTATIDDYSAYPPLPENIRSVQPGGGACYAIELAWGRLRRAYLKAFRPGYVRCMAERRRGDAIGAPHEILDPRDLKYCTNQCTAHWVPEDDPFRWRDHLPFIRWGLAELQIGGWPLLALIIGLAMLPDPWRWTAIVPAIVLVWWASFFRNPARTIPDAADAIVSPADGTITDVTPISHYDFFGGPAVSVGIFLSIFNVHINRAPRAGRVLAMHYKPGEFLDARHPESSIRNEFLWIGFEDADRSGVKFAVRQISGLLARRIVCALRPGQPVSRGVKFGMIKLGSRTELILPRDAVIVDVTVGQTVRAGSTVVGRLLG
jgi:phosphatidylserine decarboxylase